MIVNLSKNIVSLFVTFWLTAFFAASTTIAADLSYEIKASYIYNILQFITFPESAFQAKQKLDVCVVGENYFGSVLNSIEGANTPQTTIHINYFENLTPNTSLASCNVLYLTKSEANNTRLILSKVNTKNVVTIAEYTPFLSLGGLIELYTQEDKIRFRINRNKRSNFQISAQLFQLGASN